jgi:pimeloyl-ACP methyl ester carboxylesterase
MADDLHRGLVHFPMAPLRWATDDGWMLNSQAMLNRNANVTTAVVFVHGWCGRADSSWDDSIRSLPEMDSADAIFFDYPTARDTVSFAASKFTDFLIDLVRNPATSFINPTMQASGEARERFVYKKIIFVAHSMGAVVVRKALLKCENAPQGEAFTLDEFAKIRLLLFAPAHTGSRIPLLIGSGTGLDRLPGAAVIGSLLKLSFLSLRDLEEGSTFLCNLARQNCVFRERHESKNEFAPHLRARVYHASGDKVVTQHDFDADYRINSVMMRNHRTICKPADDYTKPIEALRKMFCHERMVFQGGDRPYCGLCSSAKRGDSIRSGAAGMLRRRRPDPRIGKRAVPGSRGC